MEFSQIKKPMFSCKPLQNSVKIQGNLDIPDPDIVQVGHELAVPARVLQHARPPCGLAPLTLW